MPVPRLGDIGAAADAACPMRIRWRPEDIASKSAHERASYSGEPAEIFLTRPTWPSRSLTLIPYGCDLPRVRILDMVPDVSLPVPWSLFFSTSTLNPTLRSLLVGSPVTDSVGPPSNYPCRRISRRLFHARQIAPRPSGAVLRGWGTTPPRRHAPAGRRPVRPTANQARHGRIAAWAR